MRCSWQFQWVSKPWIGASTVKSVTTTKVMETFEYIWKTHLPESVQAYAESPIDPNDADANDEAQQKQGYTFVANQLMDL